jgi:hypothetical protein
MREVIVNCADVPADFVVLYDDGARVILTATDYRIPAQVVLDRAGASALRDWLDAWLSQEGTGHG